MTPIASYCGGILTGKEGSTHEALRLLAPISRHCQHLAAHLIQLIVQLLDAGQVVPAGMSAGASGRLAT